MPYHPAALDERTLTRLYLARQGLLERSDTAADALVGRLVALQAQATHPPYTALWARLRGVTTAAVDDLVRAGVLARLALFRSTIHLVRAVDVTPFRALTAPVLERRLPAGWRPVLAGLDIERVLRRARELTAAAPLTWGELGRELLAEFPVTAPAHAQAERLLATVVRGHLPMVAVPPSMLWGDARPGRYAAHPGRDPHDLDAAERDAVRDDLLRRYLAAYGPASTADLTAFTGVTGWPAVVRRLGDEIVTVPGPHGPLLDLTAADRSDPGVRPPVRLLGEWDSALLGHADRSRITPPALAPLITTSNGLFSPVVLVDGLVAGTWKVRRTAHRAVVELRPLAGWTTTVRRDAEREALRYLDFAAPGLEHAVEHA